METEQLDSQRQLYASLTFSGKDLIPENITLMLGIKPTRMFKKGDIKNLPSGQTKVRKRGFWSLETSDKGFVLDDPLPHLEYLIQQLEPAQNELKKILDDSQIFSRISLFGIMPNGRINLDLQPGFLMRLANLNINVWLDLYCDH